ncbi:MAG: hypothetical protein Q8P62_03615 [Candidatus Peregrinibacteria bacterium]|nr:hypothetical protein [Candidatus Peregrinibacteria bacterium]
MKKILKSFLVSFMLINLGLTIYAFSTFGGNFPKALALNPLDKIQEVGNNTKLPSFTTGQHPEAPADYAQPGVGTLTSPVFFALDMAKLALSGIAMIIIVIAAIRLISTTNEEDAGKAKRTLIYSIMGMILIQLADTIVRKMFFGELGDAFENVALTEEYAKATVGQVRSVIGMAEAFLGIAAVLVIIIRGFTVMTSGGNEEALGKAKKHLMYAVAGLFVIILSEVIIRGVVFPENGSAMPDPEIAKYIIVKVVNYVVGFISIIAFVSLFYAGYLYVTSAGNEEVTAKVKKIFTASVIAIVLALGSFAIVNTLIKFTPYYGADQATPGSTPPPKK